MLRFKVTKNIMNKGGIIFGLDLKQLIIGAVGVAIGFATFFLLKDYLAFDALMWLIFLEIALIFGFLVLKINDMSLFMIIIKSLQGVDKRPYSNQKGVFDDDDFSVF